jgi:hypothetical protein
MRKDISVETAVREAKKGKPFGISSLFTYKYAVLRSKCQEFF